MTPNQPFQTDHADVRQAPSGQWAVLLRRTIFQPWKQVATRRDFALARDEAIHAEADHRVLERLYDDNVHLTPGNWGTDAPTVTTAATPTAADLSFWPPTPDAWAILKAHCHAGPEKEAQGGREGPMPAEGSGGAAQGDGGPSQGPHVGGQNPAITPLHAPWPIFFASHATCVAGISTNGRYHASVHNAPCGAPYINITPSKPTGDAS